MSWHGFVKAVNRATTSVMMSTGYVEKTVDREYERQEERFKDFQAKVEKLHREAKGYLDSVRAMTLSQQRIADSVDQFYEEGSPMGYAAIQYKDTVKKLDEEARIELDETFRNTVLDPLGKLVAAFPEFNDAMKKRDRKLLDYDRARATVKKLIDSPSTDPTKLPRAESDLAQAKQVFETINNQLLVDVPKLIELRIPFLEPSFEAMVKTQLKFNQESFERLEAVKKGFEYGGKNTDGAGLEGQVEGVLQKMRELTICGPIHSQ